MSNRIFAFVVCVFLLALTGCGNTSAEPTPPPPPEATPYQLSKDKNVDALLTSFDSNIRTYLTQQDYTPGEKAIYGTSLDLVGVKQFYDAKMAADGWTPVPNGLNDTQDRIMLSYQKSNTLFIVTAIDSSAYLGQGMVVYTIKATK